jgi:protein SCO1/2
MKPLPFALVACLFCAGAALAEPGASDPRARAAFEPRLGDALPASLAFRDESGARVKLSDYYGSAPIVLVFAWYGCSALCPTVVESLAGALGRTGISPGQGYQVIVASIDPLDSPAAAMKMKQTHVARVTTRDEARAWHLLTGSEHSIGALAQAAGFRYGYDALTDQYAHATGIVLVTPKGRIERYFPGLDFTAPGLRDALRGTATQPSASPADFVRLVCFHVTAGGRYTAAILDALRILAASALAVGLIALVRARQRGRAATKR